MRSSATTWTSSPAHWFPWACAPGSHVAIWATNIPQWFITFWATTKIGAVLVTVNTAYKIHEAEYLLRQIGHAHPDHGSTDTATRDYAAIISELCPELEQTQKGEPLHSKRLPFLAQRHHRGLSSMPGVSDVGRGASQRANRRPGGGCAAWPRWSTSDDVCNMQYTSGTTGFPKGVMLTHYNVVNNGKYIGDRMDLSTADRMMIQVPTFHCFGMVLSDDRVDDARRHHAPACRISRPSRRWPASTRSKITCFNGVPTMFIAMMQHRGLCKDRLLPYPHRHHGGLPTAPTI